MMYPRSPLIIVPPIVLVKVSVRRPKLVASPRSGVVAANVHPIKPNIVKTIHNTA